MYLQLVKFSLIILLNENVLGHPKNLAWNGGPLHLGCEHGADLWIKSGQHIKDNVIVIKAVTHMDEIYVISPRLLHGVSATVWLIVRGHRGVELQPYPDLRSHSVSDCDAIQNAVDFYLDNFVDKQADGPPDGNWAQPQMDLHWYTTKRIADMLPTFKRSLYAVFEGNLWVLDSGVIDTLEAPQCTCPPKVVEISILLGKLTRRINLSTLSEPSSLLQNVVVEYGLGAKPFVYVSDASRGAILVHEVPTGSEWSVVACGASAGLQLALVKRGPAHSVLIIVRLYQQGLLELDTAALRRKNSLAPIRVYGDHIKPMLLLGSSTHYIYLRHTECSDVLSWDIRDAFNESHLENIHSAGPRLTPTSVHTCPLKHVVLILDSNYGDAISGNLPSYHRITYVSY